MNRMLKIKLRWCVTFVAIFFILLLMFTQAHEAAHAETCKKFGGKVLGTNRNMQEMTIITTSQIAKTDAYLAADSNVDSFGYQIQAEIFSILTIVYVTGWLAIWLKQIEPKRIEGKFLRSDD